MAASSVSRLASLLRLATVSLLATVSRLAASAVVSDETTLLDNVAAGATIPHGCIYASHEVIVVRAPDPLG